MVVPQGLPVKKKTFVDSGVLLTAFRGLEPDSEDAFRILEDPDREFVSSIFVRLELLPKPVFFGNEEEIEFYEAFFQAALHWVDFSDELLEATLEEAKECGMAAMDAIHVVAAGSAGCDELVTTEKSSRPMHRSSLVKVVCIHD